MANTPSNPATDEYLIDMSEILAPIVEIDASDMKGLLIRGNKKSGGDFAFPAAKVNRFRKLGCKPNDAAKQWAEKLSAVLPFKSILSAQANGAFLAFDVDRSIVVRNVLNAIYDRRDEYGFEEQIGAGKTVIVEFSSPNIAKPFHAGHLRTTILGNFMANLLSKYGYKVVRMNYLGDWGKQYGLLACGFEKYGSEEELKTRPIKHLFDVYVKINADMTAPKDASEEVKAEYAEIAEKINTEAREYFARMEAGEEGPLALWQKFRDLSIEEYKRIYSSINVHFDVYSGESQMTEQMKKIMIELEEKSLLTEDKGAKLFDLQEDKLGKVLVQKSDGTTLYITRDLAAATTRHDEYKFDKMYYVVASQQNLHFQQLFKMLGKMGYEFVKKCEHINYGMVLGMSTRRGTVKFLSDILAIAQEKMLEKINENEEKASELEDKEKTAFKIGLSAVVVQDFSARRIKDYEFNWDRVTSFEGETGPYLQYANVRVQSIIRKTADTLEVKRDVDHSLLTEQACHDAISLLAEWPTFLRKAHDTNEPSTIVTYMFKLARCLSALHRDVRVKGVEKDLGEARLKLIWGIGQVLANGLRLIGLEPLDRM